MIRQYAQKGKGCMDICLIKSGALLEKYLNIDEECALTN